MPLPSCSVYNYELEVVTEINSNTYGPMYNNESCDAPGMVRDCFGLCKHPSDNNFGYITVCGCNTGGTCPQTCSGQGGVGIPYSTSNYWSDFPSPPAPLSIPYPNPHLYYCNTVLECSIVSDCTNPDATNYEPLASIDDGSCTFSTDPEEEPEIVDSIMYKPSIERMWTFTASGGVISDPTPGQQIDNFDEEISTGVFDISNIYYLNVEFPANTTCVDIHRLNDNGDWYDPAVNCSWDAPVMSTLGGVHGQKVICEDGTEVIMCYDETLQHDCGSDENPWFFTNGDTACDSVVNEPMPDDMIFAFVNNQLRGYANITEQGYYYLEVKWKQQLELEEIITFYLKHNGQIKLIDEIRTHNNELVENSYTSNFIYNIE